MASSVKCMITSCNQPAMYARHIGRFLAQWCEKHGNEIMRCKSNTVDVDGACQFCNAANGEACKMVRLR